MFMLFSFVLSLLYLLLYLDIQLLLSFLCFLALTLLLLMYSYMVYGKMCGIMNSTIQSHFFPSFPSAWENCSLELLFHQITPHTGLNFCFP